MTCINTLLPLYFEEQLLLIKQWLFNVLLREVRPHLYGEKLSRVKGQANFSYISLQNLANRLHEKQKIGSARRVTHLAGSPFCDGRVTF